MSSSNGDSTIQIQNIEVKEIKKMKKNKIGNKRNKKSQKKKETTFSRRFLKIYSKEKREAPSFVVEKATRS